MDAAAAFAEEIAKKTGELLLDYFRKTDLEAGYKADKTVLTEADLAADNLLRQEIHGRFPKDIILSEEDEESIFPLSEGEVDKPMWILDPLDGTTNFSLGLHIWGVLIARLEGGTVQLSIMYFPRLEECYSARRGEGAYLNGQRIHVIPPDPDRPWSFFTCCSRTHRRYHVRIPYKPRILGAAAYSFCSVARGMAVLGFEATPKIWDIAPGWLLVEEAGGVVETLKGIAPFPITARIDYGSKFFPTIIAANRELADRAQKQIIPKG